MTAIATWRGEIRQTYPHGHLGYSTHGRGNGAVAQMDDKRDRRGDQWVGIGHTASKVYNRLVGCLGSVRFNGERRGETHKTLAEISWLVRVYRI